MDLHGLAGPRSLVWLVLGLALSNGDNVFEMITHGGGKSNDGRLDAQVCRFLHLGPKLGVTVSASLGRIAVRMAELLVLQSQI